MSKIPANIPKNSTHKYVWIIEKEYDQLLKLIFDVGYYCAHRQFYSLYKKIKPGLSDNYIKKKCTLIIKELAAYDFIEVNNINKNKYLYLKKAALALFTGDYAKTPRFNHSEYLKNDKFLISLMKLEFYITNNLVINNSNLNSHLYTLTKKILNVKLKYPELVCNQKDLEIIVNEKSYTNIKNLLSNYENDNIVKIIWVDLYNIFRKLLLQNQTISLKPTYLKIFKVGDSLRIHYVPNILIWDLHDNKYYERKINNLFHDFFSINSNNTSDMQSNFKNNQSLGANQTNRFGYSLTLIGYNEDALINKTNNINRFTIDNPHTPLVKDVDYIYIDIAKYIDHASQYNSTLADADRYVYNNIKSLINSSKNY